MQVTKATEIGGSLLARLRTGGSAFHVRASIAKKWLRVYLELVVITVIIASTILLCALEAFGIISFPNLGPDITSVLGTIVQSLASIFAIVFSVSLVAIQLCSEGLSHRLISLYAKNLSFAIPFSINIGALLFNWFLLTNLSYRYLFDYGIYWSFAAILSLVPFIVYTIRFLVPDHAIDILLYQIKPKEVLLQDFSMEERYQDFLQPIEDIISNRIRHFDYTTSRRLINKVEQKMFDTLSEVNSQIDSGVDEASMRKIMVYLSKPFARIFTGIAMCSNKSDSIETTSLIVAGIANFVEHFWQSGFTPAYKVFDSSIEQIFTQAKHRYSSKEYKTDLANLEIAVSDARTMFSEYVG